ncbi:DDE superfamily endonuclease-domain-containing protein, partial [Fimicolochytrium jonesii]|uniref:DDE superfamily endonuclease-domain-containing protein n=1 Tax=Fimicolochytrium jonesii TaxID=1396493 RepID=UPI0022FE3DCD
PKATIASIVEKWKRTGNAHRSHASNRPRLMTEEMDAFVREKYDDNPALTIATVTDMMNDHFHTHITERTVEAHLNRSGNDQYRMKLMRNEPADFNNPTKICDRREWCEEFMRQHFSLDDCIHLDEAGFNLKLHRKQGRARRGRHPINVHNQRGPNHTLLVAVSRTQGVFARRLRMNLTTNGNAFEAFLTEEVLPNIDEPNKLIVLDNAPIHRTRRIKDLIQNAGHRVKMLPSYTPFFNCTEWVFGSVKPFICCNELRISNETLPQLIDDGLDRITTDMVEGWMREVMRYFLLALREEPLGRMY